jgi:aryl-alcohol dehydrogenase-like predicted oxidoreductase
VYEDVGFFGDTTSRHSKAFKESVATIEAAFDAGMSPINTGDFYGRGHNESIVTRAIEHRRKQTFLSVKFGVLRSSFGTLPGLDSLRIDIDNFPCCPAAMIAKRIFSTRNM